MSTNYEFTTNWFEYQKSVIERFILPSSKEYHFLEIGSYEGMSTVYYIDNYLENPNSTITTIDPFNISDTCSPVTNETYRRFLHNISESKYPYKSELRKDFSINVLPEFLTKKKQYDYITIDGSHISKDVIFDACMCYRLLKPSGIMFFDDYSNSEESEIKKAIDFFLTCHSDMEVIYRDYHLIVKKN